MLRYDRYGFPKKHAGTRYTELIFLLLVGSVGHVVHSRASGAQNINTLFFMLGWAWWGFHKKHARARYAKLVFLHPVGSAGHVVHPGRETSMIYFSFSDGPDAVSMKNPLGNVTPTLCFCIRWNLRVT
jgi:hypothetical protein